VANFLSISAMKTSSLMLAAAYIAMLPVATALAQSLNEQAQCATQARATAQEDNRKWELENREIGLNERTGSFDYQSHYNTKIKRCLILTTRVSISADNTSASTSKNLYDAFERRDYGFYVLVSERDKPAHLDRVTMCQLIPSYG
jgi:hypothetical protein